MYKGTARSLRRATQVHAIALSPLPGALSDDDFIPSADNMSERECEMERAQLLLEKVRCENELAIAKKAGRKSAADLLGHKLAGICSRLGLIKQRVQTLRQEDGRQTFIDAVKDVVPSEMLERIRARQAELSAERGRERRA